MQHQLILINHKIAQYVGRFFIIKKLQPNKNTGRPTCVFIILNSHLSGFAK
ncbi:hypothetical protein [Moraxella lacunata]|uniref:hypothetical protein n=1 Tax=Moraxella lacunata TaxID=477 RepID=UPI003EE2B01C